MDKGENVDLSPLCIGGVILGFHLFLGGEDEFAVNQIAHDSLPIHGFPLDDQS